MPTCAIVESHSLKVVLVVFVVRVLGIAHLVRRITIAAQVGHDDAVVVLKALRHAVPHHMRLRKTVQQDQHRFVVLPVQ